MGNSQSARRFPTLKHARARDQCQEGTRNISRSAVSRLRPIPPSLKAQGPFSNRILFWWESPGRVANIGANSDLPLLLSLRRLLARLSAATIHHALVVVRPVSPYSFPIA